MKVIILVNTRSGRNSIHAERRQALIRSAAEAAGLVADIRLVDSSNLEAEAANAAQSPVDAVVAAGGDGTVSAVAGILATSDKPLGVIAGGTLNHFARDLGLPVDPFAAARVIADGHSRQVDVGEVNGRIFLNNASIGIYPAFVLDRDGQRTRWRRKKWLAMAVAAMRAVRKLPLVHVEVRLGGETISHVTPVVLVGNNRYEFSLPSLGSRHCLDAGELSLHVAHSTTRWGIVRLALRGLMGRLRPAGDFQVSYATELIVASVRPSLSVALDGEVRRIETPLRFRVRPRVLTVLAGKSRS